MFFWLIDRQMAKLFFVFMHSCNCNELHVERIILKCINNKNEKKLEFGVKQIDQLSLTCIKFFDTGWYEK